MKQAENFRILVHTPAELATEYVAWAEHICNDPGITFGVPAIDRVMIPMRAGDLVSIIARPGHGKSSLLAYLARTQAKRIVARGTTETEAVVYVTWEQSAEELEAFFQSDGQYSVSDLAWGRAPMEFVYQQAVRRGTLPVWTIGHGIGRIGAKMPRMTPEAVLGAIETMQADFGVKPTLMLFDYMQLIPIVGLSDRFQRVAEVPIRVKELALRIGCPAVVGVQASRDVDERQCKIPEMRDAQLASTIEQTSDKAFGLWRPILTEPPNCTLSIEGQSRVYTVNERLFFIRMLKQRGDRGRYTWAMHFAPEYLRLAEIELAIKE